MCMKLVCRYLKDQEKLTPPKHLHVLINRYMESRVPQRALGACIFVPLSLLLCTSHGL